MNCAGEWIEMISRVCRKYFWEVSPYSEHYVSAEISGNLRNNHLILNAVDYSFINIGIREMVNRRKKRKQRKYRSSHGCLVTCLFLFLGILLLWIFPVYGSYALIVFILIALINLILTVTKYSGKVPDFDDMSGEEFEDFCSYLLRKNGFSHVRMTPESGDQGVDLVAYRKEVKYGFQCKRYKSWVGNKAVQEIYAGIKMYDCEYGVVLTNSRFTDSAKELAQSTDIELWDRGDLYVLIKRAYKK